MFVAFTALHGDDTAFTLVEADSQPEGKAVAVLNFQMPGANPVYRALPVETFSPAKWPAGRGDEISALPETYRRTGPRLSSLRKRTQFHGDRVFSTRTGENAHATVA